MSTICDHNEINLGIGRLEGKVDGIISRLDRINSHIENQETDIKDINRWRNRLIGKISILSGLIGAIVAGIIAYLK